jgi:hypothetical protein
MTMQWLRLAWLCYRPVAAPALLVTVVVSATMFMAGTWRYLPVFVWTKAGTTFLLAVYVWAFQPQMFYFLHNLGYGRFRTLLTVAFVDAVLTACALLIVSLVW